MGGGENSGPPAAGLKPAPPYTHFPYSLGPVRTTVSVLGRVSREGEVRSWDLDGLKALGSTHQKSSRRVPGPGSRRLGDLQVWGSHRSPQSSAALDGQGWGPQFAGPALVFSERCKNSPHLCITLSCCPENLRARVSDLDPAPHFLGLQVFP